MELYDFIAVDANHVIMVLVFERGFIQRNSPFSLKRLGQETCLTESGHCSIDGGGADFRMAGAHFLHKGLNVEMAFSSQGDLCDPFPRARGPEALFLQEIIEPGTP